jgi:1,4-dihydroxy-2-naphthoate polyprenyltransferase
MTTTETSAHPPATRAWLLAVRPPTLTAAAAPVVVASAMAHAAGDFRAGVLLVALAVAVLLQVGANLANDVFDFERGVDGEERLGPPRAAAGGMLTPGTIRAGMLVALGTACVLGLYLVYVGGWPILVLGAAAIAAALAYTGGPWPYGYHALGDAFVFAFFGLAATCGTYYLHTGEVTAAAALAACVFGALATAILVVNNVRDRATDERAGKRTLAVLLGDRAARAQYALLLAAAFGLAAALAAATTWWALLALVSAHLAARLGGTVLRGTEGRALNATLKDTARLQLIFGVLLVMGFLL